MPITRELALKIIRYLANNPSFYFPFKIMCQGYASHTDYDNDFVEIVPSDDCENLIEDLQYDTFELREDLQNLDLRTLELMSKGFIEKILKNEKNLLKDFIFITFEGMTFQPNSESDTPDIENMQVIGFEKGLDVNEAFENLKLHQEYLKETTFDEIIGIELRSKQFHYFHLNC